MTVLFGSYVFLNRIQTIDVEFLMHLQTFEEFLLRFTVFGSYKILYLWLFAL